MLNLFNKKQHPFSKYPTVLTEESLACQNTNASIEKKCFVINNAQNEDKNKFSVGDTARTVEIFTAVCMVTAESCNKLQGAESYAY